jgi:hypothetical protein
MKLKKREKQRDKKEKTEEGIRQESFKGINRSISVLIDSKVNRHSRDRERIENQK